MAKYILIQTLGATTVDPKNGDGAYAEWMARYFKSNAKKECVAFARLSFGGGNDPNFSDMTCKFKEQLKQALNKMSHSVSEVDETGEDENAMAVDDRRSTVKYAILNWHLRYTGRWNAQTGRKPGHGVIKALKEICEAKGIELKVVYTIHEYEGIKPKEHLLMADAVFALNPEVGVIAKGWAEKLKVEYGLSRVPTLHASETTKLIENVYQHLDLDEDSKERLAALNIGMFHRFQPRAGDRLNKPSPAKKSHGIVIFGSITPRHGLTSENVVNLCNALDGRNLPDDFHVLIAGKTQNPKLQTELEQLAAQTPRLHFIGEVDAQLSELDQVKYAISFDNGGFRSNASAMVNMITNGMLLFQRLVVPGTMRSNDELVTYAADCITECELLPKGPDRYRVLLEGEQELYPALSAAAVGAELDRMFAAVFSQPPRSAPPSPPGSRANSPTRSRPPSPPAKRMRMVAD